MNAADPIDPLATTSKPAMLARMDLGDVLTWRLHWLLCDLGEIRHILQTSTATATDSLFTDSLLRECDVVKLQQGPFGQALEKVQAVQVKHARLRWETMTMLGLDYDSDVDQIFASLPKQDEYKQKIMEIKGILQGMADRAIAQDARKLREAIAK